MFIDTVGAGYEETWNDLLESRENEGEAKLALYLYQQLREAGLAGEELEAEFLKIMDDQFPYHHFHSSSSL